MSIINDALKKVQQSLRETQPEKKSPDPAAPAAKEETPSSPQAKGGFQHEPPAAPTAFEHEPASAPPPPAAEMTRSPVSLRERPATSSDRAAAEPQKTARARRQVGREKLFIGLSALTVVILAIGLLLLFRFFNQSRSLPPIPEDKRFVIQGITMMKEKNVVLIGGEIYEVGDTVNGLKIVDISIDRIQVLYNGRVRTLRPKR